MENVLIKIITILNKEIYSTIRRDRVDEYLHSIDMLAGFKSVETFSSGNMKLEELPKYIQEDVEKILRVYPSCSVTYEYGKFHVTATTTI